MLSHTVHRHEPGVAVQSNIEPYVTIIDGKLNKSCDFTFSIFAKP